MESKCDTKVHNNICITVTSWKARYCLGYETRWNDAKGNNQKRSYNEPIARVADDKVNDSPSNNGNKEAIQQHIK